MNEELEKWEALLGIALNEADAALEAAYGDKFTLRSGRPESGTTVNPKYDGMFSLNAKFSLGIATGDGPGYTVDLRTSINEYVNSEQQSQFLDTALAALQEAVPRVFPDKNITIVRKGHIIRITGDMGF